MLHPRPAVSNFTTEPLLKRGIRRKDACEAVSIHLDALILLLALITTSALVVYDTMGSIAVCSLLYTSLETAVNFPS